MTTKVLFVSPPILKGSGGEVIRRRNLEFLTDIVGKDNIRCFFMGYYDLYDIKIANPKEKQAFETRKIQTILSLKKMIDEFSPDLIYMDNSLMAIPSFVFEHRTMVFFHNIEASYAIQDSSLPEYLVKEIKENEAFIVKNASLLVSIIERDSKELESLYGRKADYILPISFKDTASVTESDKKGDYLLFIGTDFYGNTDGLFRFIEECLDEIDSPLIVAGKGMEKYNGKYPDKKVTFLGYVEDLSILYANASAVILPIISGSGMKTKTCEAFMYGKKCIGTSEAFEGYENIKKANVILCDDFQELAIKTKEYLKDSHVYHKESRDYFLEYYENETVLQKYARFLKEAGI